MMPRRRGKKYQPRKKNRGNKKTRRNLCFTKNIAGFTLSVAEGIFPSIFGRNNVFLKFHRRFKKYVKKKIIIKKSAEYFSPRTFSEGGSGVVFVVGEEAKGFFGGIELIRGWIADRAVHFLGSPPIDITSYCDREEKKRKKIKRKKNIIIYYK